MLEKIRLNWDAAIWHKQIFSIVYNFKFTYCVTFYREFSFSRGFTYRVLVNHSYVDHEKKYAEVVMDAFKYILAEEQSDWR